MILVAAGDAAPPVEFLEPRHLVAERVERAIHAEHVVILKIRHAVDGHALRSRRLEHRLRSRVVRRLDRGHDHADRESLPAGGSRRAGEIGGNPFRLDMASRPHRQLDATVSGFGRGLRQSVVVEPLQRLGKEMQARSRRSRCVAAHRRRVDDGHRDPDTKEIPPQHGYFRSSRPVVSGQNQMNTTPSR